MSIVEELRKDPESGARRLEGEYKAGLMTLARRFCPDEGDAEELVNRTFAAVVAGIDDYVEQSAFFAWMCQILSHLHSMDQRRKSRRNEVAAPDAGETPDEEAAERLFESVDAALLREAIDALPKDMKQVLVMHYLMDLPLARIGKFLALPVGTVKWRLHCARSELGRRLGAQRPGVRMLVLALLLAAGLAIGGGLYALGTAVFGSHAENAESAEVVSHAENAESAEAPNAAEGGFQRAQSALPTTAEPASNAAEGGFEPAFSSTPSTPDSSEMNAKSILAASASLALAAAPAPVLAADAAISYTGAFSVADHPSIEGAKVVTLTSSGTLTVSEDVRLLRLLVVGGGGGGGQGGGGGGQVIDWTPETPVFLKRDDAVQITVGPGGYRGNQGNPDNRGHNGFPSLFRNTSLSFVALGGGCGAARNGNDNRWDTSAPTEYGNGGGGAIGNVLPGFPAGAEGCFPGGKATNYGSGSTGCGGGGGGAGAGGPGEDSQILHTQTRNDDYQDENGAYEHAGNGGPGIVSDITGSAISYGDGGGGGARRSDYKHGGAGGLGGGGRGAGLYEGSVTSATDAAPNRGGGGGGAGWNAAGTLILSGNGGSGVVIALVAPSAADEEPADRESAWAIGGTVRSWRDPALKKNWVVHEFRGSGELVVKRGFDAELLLVGGGGAGGTGSGGGGGAGGLLHTNGIHLAGGVYSATIGAGGSGRGASGGDSSLVAAGGAVSLVAPGGGGGGGGGYEGGSSYHPGRSGGSGGGGAAMKAGGAAVPDDGTVIGHAGGNAAPSGYNAGGGGGAGSAGTDGTTGSTTTCLGNGGAGLAFDITGESRFYAAGGGAGYSSNTSGRGCHGIGGSGIGGDGEIALASSVNRRPWGQPGLDGTGSGGGGGGQGAAGVGGKGGDGVLILRYLADPPGTMILVK